MSEENDIIAEEIYEYYKDKIDSETDEAEPEKQEIVKKKTALSSAAQAISNVTDRLSKNVGDKKGLYITLAALSAVIVIMLGALGGIIIPQNDTKVEAELEKLRRASAVYTEAKADNERLNERINTLHGDQAEVKAELEGITDYEAIRDRAKQDKDDVSKQLEDIRSQVEAKQSEVGKLDEKIKEMGGEITLTPGMYTVGEHIAAGEYHVKGDGSILVSDSDSKLKINTKLTDTSYLCRLSDGYTVKLETEAKFNPVQ